MQISNTIILFFRNLLFSQSINMAINWQHGNFGRKEHKKFYEFQWFPASVGEEISPVCPKRLVVSRQYFISYMWIQQCRTSKTEFREILINCARKYRLSTVIPNHMMKQYVTIFIRYKWARYAIHNCLSLRGFAREEIRTGSILLKPGVRKFPVTRIF